MQNSSFYNEKKTHHLALLFAVGLLVLLAAEFASFSLGAYFVFNKPISYVVAETTTSTVGATLAVQASDLQPNTTRMLWIDPQLTYDSSGNPYINTNSGFKIQTVRSDPNGNLNGSFQISSSVLQQISTDGQSVHEVWVVGLSNSTMQQGGQTYTSLTSDSEQNYSAATRGSGITFFITLITFVVPVNFSLGELFIVLWTIYLILFAMAMNGPFRNMLSAMRETAVKGSQALFSNAMFAMLIVFPVVLWITVGISYFEQAAGVSTGSLPPTDPLLELVELAIAPLREELGFRVIPIGVVALLVLFAKGKLRDGLLALWHPSRYLKKDQTPEEYRRTLIWIYVAIGVSAALFGLAHVLLGAGWGPGKILSAAVAGVGLAGLYYLYGFPATVLLHWSIDYFLSTFDLIPSTQTFGGLITLYTLFISIGAGVVLIILLVRRFRNHELGVLDRTWERPIST